MFIDCFLTFRTSSPALNCKARAVLLPTKTDASEGSVSWKIWVLTTWVDSLVLQPEDTTLLTAPGRKLEGVDTIETDVFIVGAGTS